MRFFLEDFDKVSLMLEHGVRRKAGKRLPQGQCDILNLESQN